MSVSKRLLEEKEENRRRAFEILEEIDAIEYCLCGRIFRISKNEANAYPYATQKYKEKYLDDANFKEFQEQVKAVLNEALPAGEKCPNCESDD